MALVIENVTKQYKDKLAVNNVSATLEKGVIGLLGANGAGKTTLMSMICGVKSPTSGKITFDGVDVKEEKYREYLGYLPQDFGYYPNFTGRDFLRYMAAIKGINKADAEKRINELLKIVNLEDAADRKMKSYSGGMKQRIGIAQAVLNNPQILVLDEPTAGLDPKERVRFRNLIDELGQDCIVILSTHIVSDVEHIADRILMMNNGEFVFDGTKEDADGDLEKLFMSIFGEV